MVVVAGMGVKQSVGSGGGGAEKGGGRGESKRLRIPVAVLKKSNRYSCRRIGRSLASGQNAQCWRGAVSHEQLCVVASFNLVLHPCLA